MRRKEREVTDLQEIVKILRNCNTLRIGMNGEEYPYVVPVSFGLEVIDDKTIIYFHCAKQGLKNDLLEKNENVCIEGDTFLGVQKTPYGITTRYTSIIGFGKCKLVQDSNEIINGLKSILNHYDQYDYPLDRCKGIDDLYIYKIVIDSITGKQNLPE